MKAPENEMREYLQNLINNFIRCKENYNQLDEFFNWINRNGYETVKQAEDFYYLVFYNFRKVLLLELYKLFSEKEDRTILDWLSKASTHANSLNLVHVDPWIDDEEKNKTLLRVDHFREIVDEHKKMIDSQSHLIKKLKNLRDKHYTHADKKYYEKGDNIDALFPIRWKEISLLINCADQILTKQYEILFNTEYSTNTLSSGGIETVLKSTRAFSRIRKNKKLLHSGFKPLDYLRDDYEGNED